MATRESHRLVHAAAAARRPDARLVGTRLRDEEVVRGIDVARPFFVDDSLRVLRRQAVETLTTALAESSVIDRERMNPRRRELRRERIPRPPCRVAHVQEDHRRARLRGRVVRRFELDAIGRFHCHLARRRRRLRKGGGAEEQNGQAGCARYRHERLR